jgi:hypothetical protein
MKINKKLILMSASVLFFTACKSDENCTICENKNLNETSTVEICQEGADLIVTTEIIKIKSDTIIMNSSAAEYKKIWEARGYTCK